MPNTPSNHMQAAGFPTALAAEIQRQAESTAGNVNRLIAVGMPLSVAVNLAPMLTNGSIDSNKLIASGLNHKQAAAIANAKFGVPPSNTVAPSITGTTTEGQTLTMNNGTWSGSTPRTFSRVWKRDGVVITGETATTYLLAAEDVDAMISGTVTLTNDYGSASADADAVGPIGAA